MYRAGDGQGSRALRERLVPLMDDEGVDADPDDMLITAGVQQALDLVAKIFVDPGDEIVVEAPGVCGRVERLQRLPAPVPAGGSR